ncbi:MAG TPA: PHP-associated domain-containing protein [Isosphaeraceae bacterium]|nr:PHP-associated domain-containing protein [Isosphaeraceae bacterium]
MAKFDHHLHTTRHSDDSNMTPDDLITQARAVGLDGVIITEHDYQWSDEELAELAEDAGGLSIFSGAEVSTREGHFLVYGLPDLNEAPPGLSLTELLDVVRRYEAAIVVAHPYRWDQEFDAIIAEHGPVFDALELVSKNVTSETRRLTEKLLRKHPQMGATGSSDAHEVDTLGCYYSEVPGPITTIADFVAALRNRTIQPRHRPGASLASGPIG